MKTKELRIGNYVNYFEDSTIFEVVQVESNGLEVKNKNEFTWIEIENFEGIPITEEWLLRFGFEKYADKTNLYLISIHEFNLKKLCVYLDANDCTIAMVDYFSNLEKTELFPLNYKYIHQLQNLFYSITQTELQCKVETNGLTLE